MEKFFDMMDIEVLIQEAEAVSFPLAELALSLAVHQAPRRLRIGKVCGEAICGLGRAILAGCKRSTNLARAYTLRMARNLSRDHPRIQLHQHVDDMTNIVAPLTFSTLVQETIDYIRDFRTEAEK